MQFIGDDDEQQVHGRRRHWQSSRTAWRSVGHRVVTRIIIPLVFVLIPIPYNLSFLGKGRYREL